MCKKKKNKTRVLVPWYIEQDILLSSYPEKTDKLVVNSEKKKKKKDREEKKKNLFGTKTAPGNAKSRQQKETKE